MDFSKLKKLHSDDKFTTLVHPHGHTIKVAHDKLAPEHKEALQKLEKFQGEDGVQYFAEKGLVEPNKPEEDLKLNMQALENPISVGKVEIPSTKKQPDAIDTAMTDLGMQSPMQQPLSDSTKISDMVPNMPNPALDEANKPSNFEFGQQQQPQMQMPQMPDINRGLEMQKNAYQTIGQEQAKSFAAQQDIQARHAQTMQNLNDETQRNLAEYQQASEPILQAMKNNEIRPDAYYADKSTMGKVSTAIGLLLGGIGAGATGHNVALEFLNKNIDRNIEAQKANISRQHTILGALQQKFQDSQSANLMTKAIMQEKLVSDIQQQAAKLGTATAQQQAALAIGPLQQQIDQNKMIAARREALLGGYAQNKVPPSMLVSEMVPEKHQTEAFKEVKEHEVMQQTINNVKQVMDHMAQLQKVGQRVLSPLQSKRQIDSLGMSIDFLVKEIANRVSDKEIEVIKHAKPQFGDDANTVKSKTRDIMEIIARNHSAPIMQGFGVPLKLKMPSTNEIDTNRPSRK